MKPNWNEAPERAEFYAFGKFRKLGGDDPLCPMMWSVKKSKWLPSALAISACQESSDYCERPKDIDNLNIDKVVSLHSKEHDGPAYSGSLYEESKSNQGKPKIPKPPEPIKRSGKNEGKNYIETFIAFHLISSLVAFAVGLFAGYVSWGL